MMPKLWTFYLSLVFFTLFLTGHATKKSQGSKTRSSSGSNSKERPRAKDSINQAKSRLAPKDSTIQSNEHRLMRRLFRYYDPAVRPRYNSSGTVDVRVRFSLQQINDLDEKRQILKMSGWLTAEWQDDFLEWNPKDFGGMSSVVVDPSRMWIPKLAIGNSANRLFHGDHYKRFWVTVRSNGQARWQPGGVFAIACALEMNFYPFDDQKCTMEIETWVYTADKVNLTHSMDKIGLDTYVPHGEWMIINTWVWSEHREYRYYAAEQFPEVFVTIYMRRKHTFYFMYILLPCLMLSGVLLMIFLLPADSGEKVSLGVSILVAISVFLLLVAGNVPNTSDAIPIIAIYLTYFMMVTTMSVALSVLIVKFHFKTMETRPPYWVRVFIFKYLAKVVFLDHRHRMSRLVSGLRRKPRRDATWSETATEEIKSQTNSHGTVTPEGGGAEAFELLHQRRRTTTDDNVIEHSNHLTCRGQCNNLENHGIEEYPYERPIVNEWKKIAEVLDRTFFYLFLIFLIVPTATILGVVRLFKPDLYDEARM